MIKHCRQQDYEFHPVYGWYYYSSSNRTASWTGAEYLYRFLTANKGVGLYAKEVGIAGIEPGDIVQLGDGTGYYYHNPMVVEIRKNKTASGHITPEDILLAAHTYDVYGKPLDGYVYGQARFLHIEGGRNW